MFYFLILVAPANPSCIIWMDHQPEPADYLPPACKLMDWDFYNLRAISWSGEILCEWPAAISLTDIPCALSPSNNYHVEVWLNIKEFGCGITTDSKILTLEIMETQCPELADKRNEVEVRGPYNIEPPDPPPPPCILPPVNNSIGIATNIDYQFLSSRLNWWGVDTNNLDWQNSFDNEIQAAAREAGVPGQLLKRMIGIESQFWPLWTGDKGEVGWMQVTPDGADTALRNDPDLFQRYCRLAIWSLYCTGYDQITDNQRYLIRSKLLADLIVNGPPVQAAEMAAGDLWTYAHVLRGFACMAKSIYPELDPWRSAAVVYNAGVLCITQDGVCPQGIKYLNQLFGEEIK
jgi:hypothetical protein